MAITASRAPLDSDLRAAAAALSENTIRSLGEELQTPGIFPQSGERARFSRGCFGRRRAALSPAAPSGPSEGRIPAATPQKSCWRRGIEFSLFCPLKKADCGARLVLLRLLQALSQPAAAPCSWAQAPGLPCRAGLASGWRSRAASWQTHASRADLLRGSVVRSPGRFLRPAGSLTGGFAAWEGP